MTKPATIAVSPLPWTTGTDVGCFTVISADKKRVGETENGTDMSAANAAFIVLACNSHHQIDKLAGALRSIASNTGHRYGCGDMQQIARVTLKEAGEG